MTATLVICPRYPLPELTGADMRTMHFVRYFRRLGPVDIAHVTGNGDTAQPREADGFREVMRLQTDGNVKFRWRFLRGILSGRPPQVYRYQPGSRRMLLRRIRSGAYGWVLFRYVASTGIVWGLSPELRQRVILDYDDIISGSLYDGSLESDVGSLERALLSLNRRLIRRYEHRCLRLGATLVCSEDDRTKLTDGRHRPPFVVPNVYQGGEGLASFVGDGFAKGDRLLFVGTLSYGPNSEGLRWFLDNVFPAWRRSYPEGTLSVVGRNPPMDLRDLCERQPGVQLYADVPDLRPFYRDARAVVVPLLAGGGTRIKILEAANAGRPVLSTPIGAEGLQLRDDREILIFRDEREFIAKYEHLVLRADYELLADRSRAVVNRRYSPQSFDEALTAVSADLHTRLG